MEGTIDPVEMPSSGWINWPTHLRNTNEGGMFVMAVAWVQTEAWCSDDFAKCFEATALRLLGYDVNANDDAGNSVKARDCGAGFATEHVLAAVMLGSTRASYAVDPEDCCGTWVCTREDLTPEGRALVETLDRLYNRRVALVTFLDT